MYPTRLIVPALVAILSFTACGEDTSGRDLVVAPESTVAVFGTYAVQSVDGAALPAAIFRRSQNQDDIQVYQLKSGSLIINPGGTFVKTNQLTKDGVVGAITENCTGTYFKDGSVLFFYEALSGSTCWDTFSGTFDGSARMTLRQLGQTIVLQK